MTLKYKGILFLSGVIILSLIYQLFFERAVRNIFVEGFDDNAFKPNLGTYHPVVKDAVDAIDNISEIDKQTIIVGATDMILTAMPLTSTQEVFPSVTNRSQNAISVLSRLPPSDKTKIITALMAIDKASNNIETEPIIEKIITIFDKVSKKDMETIQTGISSVLMAIVGQGGLNNPTTPTSIPDITYTRIQSSLKVFSKISKKDKETLTELVGIVFMSGLYSLTNGSPFTIATTAPTTSSLIFDTTEEDIEEEPEETYTFPPLAPLPSSTVPVAVAAVSTPAPSRFSSACSSALSTASYPDRPIIPIVCNEAETETVQIQNPTRQPGLTVVQRPKLFSTEKIQQPSRQIVPIQITGSVPASAHANFHSSAPSKI